MGIVFSRAWEDDRLDVEILAVSAGERALVVAGAGDSALALSAAGACVVAVDVNPDQLALVALKAAARRSLTAEERYAWFEAGRPVAPEATYRDKLRPFLAPDVAAFWDRHLGLLAAGLHARTPIGSAFSRLGRLVRTLTPGMADMIETVPDAEAQLRWWRRRARPFWFSPLTHIVARHTNILAPLAPNASELARMRDGRWTLGLVERIDAVLGVELVREHPWWRPAFAGRPVAIGDAARWLALDPGGCDPVIETPVLVRGDVSTVLATIEPGLAAISLSNVPDWLSDDQATELAAGACRALVPGGRVLVRHVVRPSHDAFEAAGLVRDSVSDSLPVRDRTALYEAIDLYRKPALSYRQ